MLSGVGSTFTLTFDENPLAEFVELPDDALEGGLWFSNVYCGVLRGALEMVRQKPAQLVKLLIVLINRFKCKWKLPSFPMCCAATNRQTYG